MTFQLGKTSLAQIANVHPELQKLVKATIGKSPVDFGILENGGFRTVEMQEALYAQGRSAPGNRVTDKDGVEHLSDHQSGLAVDLVPYVARQFTWHWEFIFPVIRAAAVAAKELRLKVRWGGVWDRLLTDLDPEKLEAEVDAYCKRHAGPDLTDGPHIQLEVPPVIAAPKPVKVS